MTEKRENRASETESRKERASRNPSRAKKEPKASSVLPGMTPGYDYVWDADETYPDPDHVPDPEDYYPEDDPEEYR